MSAPFRPASGQTDRFAGVFTDLLRAEAGDDPVKRAALIAADRGVIADFPAHTGDTEALVAAARLTALSPDPEDHATAREVLSLLSVCATESGM